MAFPTVVGTDTYTTGADIFSSFPVPLPSGDAGDLLLVIARAGETTDINIPSGWTRLVYFSSSGSTSVFARSATNTEGSTLTLTTPVGRRLAANVYRIRNWAGFFYISDAAGVAANTGSTISCPASTFDSDTFDVLWLSILTQKGNRSVTGTPASYTNLIAADTACSNSGCAGVWSVRRARAAVSETPGSWTLIGSAYTPHQITIGILPADIYYFSGDVKDKNGNFAQNRNVFVFRESDNLRIPPLKTGASGQFKVDILRKVAHTIVFGGEPDRNAIVYSGVMPFDPGA
jgi:hypothetical protein